MLNTVTLQGRLVADPEITVTQSGDKVARIRLAVDRDYTNKSTGERGADFFNVVAWRARADFINNYFRKGSAMIVTGRLESRSYKDRDGNSRTAIEINGNSFYFADSKRKNDSAAEGTNSAYQPPAEPPVFEDMTADDGELPF